MPLAHRKPFALVSAALALAIAVGCGTLGAPLGSALAPKGITAKSESGISIFVEPEAGAQPIVDLMASAKASIDLEMYMMSNDTLINGLIAAAKRGVKVRVMLEPNPFNPSNPNSPLPINKLTLAKLKGTGIQVAWSDPAFKFTHAKTMVVDRAVALIMTLNFTDSGTGKNREFGVIDTDPIDVRDMNRIFEADWSHVTYVPKSKRLVVSPTNAQPRLRALIAGAKKSLIIDDEILYDVSTMELLGAKVKEGVDVKVLMGDPTSIPGNKNAADKMKAMGISVHYIETPVVHAKMIVADDSRGYIGSVNLTSTSLLANREVGIILEEPSQIGVLTGTFQKDWAASKDFPPGDGGPITLNPPGEGDRG